jgi:hypothetical protein
MTTHNVGRSEPPPRYEALGPIASSVLGVAWEAIERFIAPGEIRSLMISFDLKNGTMVGVTNPGVESGGEIDPDDVVEAALVALHGAVKQVYGVELDLQIGEVMKRRRRPAPGRVRDDIPGSRGRAQRHGRRRKPR